MIVENLGKMVPAGEDMETNLQAVFVFYGTSTREIRESLYLCILSTGS